MTASNGAETAVRWLDRLLLAELVGLTFLLGCFLDKDTDIWWHLRAGREILAGGGIPRTDSYSFAAQGAEWIDLHWGFQALAAWIFAHGGFVALTVSAALASSLAVAIALAGTAPHRSAVVVIWCWLPAVLVMSDRFFPRPEILSLVCLAAYLCILQNADSRPWQLWLLVPIQLVWVNVHALFVLGPIVLGCWLIDRAVQGEMFRSREQSRHLWAAPAAVFVTCFINPYTWKGVLFPLTLFRRMSTERGFYGQHIGELMSIPDLVRRTGITSVYLRISFVLLAASAASFALRHRRARLFPFRLLIFVTFAVLGLLASRNQPQFAVIAGAVLAWNVGDWLAARPQAPIVDRAIARIITSAVLVGLMIWVASGRFYTYAAEGRTVGLGEQPFWYAHDAARFAAQDDMPRSLIAYHEGQAAVLDFHMRPDQRVFVDPRLEIAPRSALQAYYDIAAAMAARQSGWHDRLMRLPQPLGMLVDHRSHHSLEAALLAHEGWRCVWFDALAGVYVPSNQTRVVEPRAVDFGARYFDRRQVDTSGSRDAAAGMSVGQLLAEGESLSNVGRDLLAGEAAARPLGRLLLLLAAAKGREVTALRPHVPRATQLLAGTSLNLYGSPDPDAPATDWQPEMLIGIARARYFLNQTVQQAPADFQVRLALFGIAQALGDPDALWIAGGRLADLRAGTAAEFEVQRQVRMVLRNLMVVRAAEPPLPLPLDVSDVKTTVRELVGRHRFVRALDILERSVGGSAGIGPLPWELADSRALLYLSAGDTVRARTIWLESGKAGDHRSDIERRVAAVSLIEGRLSEAEASYSATLIADPGDPLAHYGLATCYLERGDAARFARECSTAVQSGRLPRKQVDFCRDMGATAAPYVTPDRHRGSIETIGRPDSR